MDNTPNYDNLELRKFALKQAVKVSSRQQVGKYDGTVIVNVANCFYEFLKDGNTK